MKILGHEILFKTLVGSRSHGSNIETSDFDYKGIFVQNPEDNYINGYKDELKISDNEVYYEITKFLSLCSGGDPSCLEVLYAPKNCIIYNSETFQKIIDIREIFLTKNLRHSFAGYAVAQIKKANGLDKKMNWEKDKTIRKSVEDMCTVYKFPKKKYFTKSMFETNGVKFNKFLEINKFNIENCGLVKIEHFRDCYLLFHSTENNFKGISSGENANDVMMSAVPKYEIPIGILFFHKDAYSTHCKNYKEYIQWLENRNTQRYIDTEEHGQKIDGKNLLHCVRLLETAMEIPIDKSINIFRKNAKYLIDIRKGKFDLKTLLNKCEKDIEILNKLYLESDLPDNFSEENIILVRNLCSDIKRYYFDLFNLNKYDNNIKNLSDN